MEDKDTKEPLPPIIDQVKEYLETYIKLKKLEAVEKGTSVLASVVIDVFVIMCLALLFVFVSITLALYLGSVLHSYWQGFGCVAVLYMICIAFVVIFRKSLETPLINFLLKKLF